MADSQSAPEAPSMFRFSTADYPVHKRAEAWREVFGRTVLRVDIEPLEREGFHAEATGHLLPGLAVLFATTSAVRQGNSLDLITGDDLSFAAPTCPYSVSQLGRSPMCGPGDGILMANDDVGKAMFSAACSYTMFSVPVAAMKPLVPDIGAALMRPIPAGSLPLRLLMRYLDIARDTQALNDPNAQRMVATHVYDLLALTLGATRDGAHMAEQRGARAARFAAIKADIHRSLHQRELTLETIAARHRLSPRTVQLLFESEETTFSKFVIEQRLAAAYRLLRDPRHGDKTISAIALISGFGDLSYFNRSFRRRFGMTPSDARYDGDNVRHRSD